MAVRTFLLLCVLVPLSGCNKDKGPVVVSVDDVLEASKGPAGEGNRRWKGKVLQISGPVKDSGATSLTILDREVFVVCYLKPVEGASQRKITAGQRVTVRGRCTSIENLAVKLEECEVVP
jgi:tRNA_anti-like